MNGTALGRDLASLLKHYAAVSPSSPTLIPSPPFPSPRDLSTPAAQQWIVDHLLALNQTQQDGARAWKKAFWSRVVKGIEVGFAQRRAEGDEAVEDEETHPDLLETMVDYLSSPTATSAGAAPGVSRRVYYYGPFDGPIDSNHGLAQACVALSNHLLADPTLVLTHKRIIELGAGVGLLSLVSAKLSAGGAAPEIEGAEPRIVATDVDEKVLEMLQANIAENGMQARVNACALDWELAPDPEHDTA
ncbi:hypothetical protein B0A53_02518 [Rhodotorula sp. CCFEE 5036]|nr:hypothetical protein B0A53_02518 [Rhodotorula sp. CCFEE 5036]